MTRLLSFERNFSVEKSIKKSIEKVSQEEGEYKNTNKVFVFI